MPIDVARLRAALADRYAIEREIGRGGMATVFLAEDLKHRRQVAVKVLEPELASSIGAERFLREIETAARLNHPHILPLYDSGEADGFLYYVMPYMEGDSLRDHLDRERQLPVGEAVQLARDIARGLDYAHEQDVVHRDIKPGNIMLSRGHAVIADFGIARAVMEAGGEQLTRTGISLGSPTYMSPEQASGGEAADGRADIYALGCLLYEMLAGEPPFVGKTSASLMARKELESAPKLGGLRETVPPELEDAVARALARVPADRFRTAGEMSDALATIPLAPVSGATAPAGRGGLRWAVGVAAVALLLVAGWLFVGRERAQDSTTSTDVAAVPNAVSAPGAAAASSVDPRSIAVLPLYNRSAEGEDAAFFADGIHEEILTQLSKVASLKVTSRTSVEEYRSPNRNIREIAEELGVGTILEGGVLRSGDRVRVTVQLIDARDDSHMWAERYDRELTAANIFEIQTEIAEHVTAALEVTLTPGEQARIRAQRTDNFEAYELYLRGVTSFNRFFDRFDEEELHETAEFMKAAIELDPNFAAAHAKLANTYFGLDQYDDAVATARKALELDATIGEAHATLALVAEATGEYETADSEYRRAIDLSPSLAGVREWYGDMLLQQFGRVDEALRHYLRAHELSPTSQRVNAGVGQAYYLTRDYDRAIDYLRRALEDSPEDGFAVVLMFRVLARSLLEKGLYEEAIDAERKGSEVSGPGTPTCLDACTIALARSGRLEEAGRSLDALIAYVEDRGSDADSWRKHSQVARVHAARGDADAAFEWLERDLEENDLTFTYLLLDPQWDPLRSDPRFDELLRRMRLAD